MLVAAAASNRMQQLFYSLQIPTLFRSIASSENFNAKFRSSFAIAFQGTRVSSRMGYSKQSRFFTLFYLHAFPNLRRQ